MRTLASSSPQVLSCIRRQHAGPKQPQNHSSKKGRGLQTLFERSWAILRQQCVNEVILPSSRSFASALSHFQTLRQHVLTHNCSVLVRSLGENQLRFRSLTKCSHRIKTHDAVTPLYCQQIDQRSVVNIRDRIFAPVLIASSRFQSFTAPVSNRCVMCSTRLFCNALLSSRRGFLHCIDTAGTKTRCSHPLRTAAAATHLHWFSGGFLC